MTKRTSARNLTVDLMKGIAVIFMIQVHLMELFCRQDIYDGLAGRISLFLGGIPAAPVFMVIMGYYVARSRKTFSQAVIRGIKIILLGFALNIGLNFHLLIKIYNGTFKIDPLPYLFGVDILFLAGLSIIILSIIKKFRSHQLIISSVALLMVFVVQLIIKKYIQIESGSYILAYFWGENTWWSYFPLIPWLAYPLTGFIFYKLESNLTPFIKKWLVYILLTYSFMTALFADFGMAVSADLDAYYHHGYLFFFYAVFFLIAWASLNQFLAQKFANPVMSYIEWMGKYVTEAYVIQWLIIGNIATGLYKTQSLTEFFLWFLFVMLATSAGVWLWVNRKKSSTLISRKKSS